MVGVTVTLRILFRRASVRISVENPTILKTVRVISHSAKENSVILPNSMPRLLPSTSFAINLPFDAIQNVPGGKVNIP
jgi:hypothetical protein